MNIENIIEDITNKIYKLIILEINKNFFSE